MGDRMRLALLCLGALLVSSACSSSTQPPDPTVPASITIDPDPIQSIRTTCAAADGDRLNGSHQVIGAPVTWRVGDTTIAIIYNSVAYRGLRVGKTTMIATAGPVSKSAELDVVREPITTIYLTPFSATVTPRLAPMQARPAGVVTDSLTGRVIMWGTHNPAIISVSATGMVHALASGHGYVIASSEGVVDSAGITVP